MVKNFRWWSVISVCTLCLSVGNVSGQTTLALYDAGLAGGGPADLNPVLQGWTPSEVDDTGGPLTNVFPLQPDGATGFNAWQINDQHGSTNPSPNDNPGYTSALSAQDLQDMFDFGWEFEFRFRPVETGNFAAWGAAAGSPFTPGARERVGFGLSIDAGTNAAVVSPEGGAAINLGPSSADSYHVVKAVGTAASTSYDVFVNDVFSQTLDISTGTSNSGFDDVVRFESGSSGGEGRVANYNYFQLTRGDTPGAMELNIARETGQIEMTNNTGSPITILGYSILNDFGALQPADWLSIADNYDAGNPGPNQVDPNNNWTILTNPNSRDDLSEAELEGGDGATIADGQTIDLGPAWLRQFNEDLELELLLDDGDVINGIINFSGNNDEPYAFGDLSGPQGAPDGAVDLLDWNAFQAGYGTNLAGLSSAEAYLAADLNDDGLHTLEDFRGFEAAFDAVNGPGAFQRMVPEPSCLTAVMFAGFAILACQRRRLRGMIVPLALAVAFSLGGGNHVMADITVALYDAGVAGGGPVDLDPTLQGWNADEVLTSGPDQNVFFLQPDGATGFNAVQINDQQGGTDNDNPRYDVGLASADLLNMFAFGWEYEFRWRPVQGGTFNQWGVGLTNPWSTDRERVGFGVSIDTSDNSAVVSPTNGTPINLGPNSADSYHTVLARGAPSSPMYELFIDGVLQGTQDLTTGTSNSANDDVLGFQSGSSGGTGRVGNYNLVRLAIDTPDLLTLTVNTTTGAARISNEFNDVLDVDSYSITSASNALTPGTWSPLEDDPNYGNGVSGDGIGFEVISATTAQLAEADLTGFSTFNPTDSANIGSIFATGMSQDLVFRIGLNNGAILEANVVYEMGGVNGDFDNNGLWECADIDALVAAIAGNSTDLSFDMNGDGVLTLGDITDAGAGWLAVGGANNPAATGGNAFLSGDANLDGSVDVPDFNRWNGNKFTNVAAWCEGDFNADGSVDVPDFNAWNGNKFTSSQAAAVPEPSGWIMTMLAIPALLAFVSRRSATRRSLCCPVVPVLTLCIVSLALVSATQADVFVDRLYQFGDDSFEAGAVGDVLGANVPAPFNDGRTLDSKGGGGVGDLQDLFRDTSNSANAPVYVDTLATGRPAATNANKLGVRFDGDGDSIAGRELNSPNDTWRDLFNDNAQYPNNWTNIFNRGMQLWVRPDASTGMGMAGIGGGLRQDVVTDTGEHGFYISDTDNWGLRFDDAIIESSEPAIAGEWKHIMTRTLNGAQGGALWVDGIAVAARGTFYDPEDGDMSVGGNQDLTTNFFKGDVDELTMFVWGDNSNITPAPGEPAGMDWGTIDMAVDNQWIQMELDSLGVTDRADVNLDTVVDNDDVTAFVAGWRSDNLVNDVPVGDWLSRQNGDLNYDGTVDLNDAFVLHEGLLVATGQGLDFSLLVPEPTGMWLLFGLLVVLANRSRGGERSRF